MSALLITTFYFKAGFTEDVFHTCRFTEILSSPVSQKAGGKCLASGLMNVFICSRLYLLLYMFFYGACNARKEMVGVELQDLVQ